MKSKRDVLKAFALNGSCAGIACNRCQYDATKACTSCSLLRNRLIRIGAMAILRMFPEKRELDLDKILTCVTADKAVEGARGYFADSLVELRTQFNRKEFRTLHRIRDEEHSLRFTDERLCAWALFYPIEEMTE